MMADIPFNMHFTFDDDLREVPKHADDMKRGIDHLKTCLANATGDKALKLMGLIGTYSRIVGRLAEAEYYLSQAIEGYKSENMFGAC